MSYIRAIKFVNKIGIYFLLFIGIAVTIFPILWMISTSFKSPGALFEMPPQWIPAQPTLSPFKNLFKSDSSFLYYYRNSVIVSGGTTIFSVALACLAGYGFSRFRFRGRKILMLFILIFQMFPVALLLISMFAIFNKIGLINTYHGLILAYSSFALPFSIWMLKGYFDSIPREIDEAALIDGCNRINVLLRVILPVAGPALISVSLFVFLVGWNELMFALTLNTLDIMRTIPPGLILTYQGQYQVYWAEMMAASLLVSVPVILLFILMQRYFIQGMTMGAVKE